MVGCGLRSQQYVGYADGDVKSVPGGSPRLENIWRYKLEQWLKIEIPCSC